MTQDKSKNSCAEMDSRWDSGEKERVSNAARQQQAAEAATAAPASPGAQLVCHYWTGKRDAKGDARHWGAASLHTAPIVVEDSTEARTAAYWRKRLAPPDADPLPPLPPGLTVTFWSNGYGYKGERHAISLDGSESNAPPVAGSMSERVRIQLPHGAVRYATLMPMADGITYLLSPLPGDRQDIEAWEDVVPTKPKEPPRGAVGQSVLARARARAAQRALDGE